MGRSIWKVYATLTLLAALFLRAGIFAVPLAEHDERIYRALTEQTLAGNGNTLRGHSLLESGWVEKRMYDSPVFFHPPVGIWVFALASRLGGGTDQALQAAQLFCFAVFFFAMLFVFAELLPEALWISRLAFPPLVALTPIIAHVGTKVWLENPRLAFFALTLAASVAPARMPGVFRFLVLAAASLLLEFTKIESVIALPFVYGLSASLSGGNRFRRALVALFALNLLAAGGWLWYSEAMHYGPGRPTEALLAANSFVRHVTSDTSPARFFLNFLTLCATLLPSAFAVFFFPGARGPRFALLSLVLSQCFFYVGLSAFGYSKMARYLVLAVPGSLLLFAYACEGLARFLPKAKPCARRGVGVGLAAALAICFALECGQGVNVLVNHVRDALVEPVF
jgi:hypothetical protein